MSINSKKSVYNIFIGVGSQLLIVMVGVLLPRLFITSFGSEVNGFLSSINQIFAYIVLLEAGVGTASLQALYRPVAEEDHDRINGVLAATARFYRKTGYCYLACVVGLAVIYPLVVESSIPVWQQVLVILIVGGSASIGYFAHAKYRILLRADGRQYVYTNVYTLVQLGTSLTKVVMILLGLNIVFIQLGHMVLTLGLAAYITWYAKHRYPWLDLKVKPDMEAISQKKSVLVHEIAQMIFTHTDVIILTLLADLKVVSVYVVYNMVVETVETLISNIHNGFSFRLGQIYNTDLKRYVRVYDLYETAYMAGSCALYCITYLLLLPFMKLYTAGVTDINYLDKWLPVLFVAIKLFVSGRKMASCTITYAGHFKKTQWRAVLEAAINLTVSIAGVCLFGIYGVLFGTLAALLYRANDVIIYTNARILGRDPWQTYSRWLVNICIFVLVCWLESYIPIQADHYFSLILQAVLYTISVCLAFFLGNLLVFPKQFKKIFAYLGRMIKSKRHSGQKV